MVVVLIDGEFLRKVYKNKSSSDSKIDIFKLIDKVLSEIGLDRKNLLRVYYYTAPPYKSNPPTKEEEEKYKRWKRFIDRIKNGRINIDIRLGKLKRISENEYEQKMVDVLMSIDLVHFSSNPRINKIIFIAGDDDYVPAVKRAKDNGVKIYLFYTEENTGKDLKKEVDERVLIDEDFIKEITQDKEQKEKQDGDDNEGEKSTDSSSDN